MNLGKALDLNHPWKGYKASHKFVKYYIVESPRLKLTTAGFKQYYETYDLGEQAAYQIDYLVRALYPINWEYSL